MQLFLPESLGICCPNNVIFQNFRGRTVDPLARTTDARTSISSHFFKKLFNKIDLVHKVNSFDFTYKGLSQIDRLLLEHFIILLSNDAQMVLTNFTSPRPQSFYSNIPIYSNSFLLQ